MDLQNIFYLVGIIFMGLLIVLMAIMVIILFVIKKRITEFVDRVKDIVSHPGEIAAKMIKKGLGSRL
jgi:hypothetical protein